MAKQRVITREIGNLRGFSTDSIFTRPPNVATAAVNVQKGPDGTINIRRGYQAQIGLIGGMGIGTFDDPALEEVQTVTVGMDGYVYNKLTKQIFFYYDGQVTGVITNITNANPAVVTSVAHGLATGAQVILRDIGGMVSLNNLTFTITVLTANTFSLNGVDSTLLPAYTAGGIWSLAFADQRYLVFSIFTDPNFIYSNAQQSITSSITVTPAATVNGTQNLVNTLVVDFGHKLVATDVVQFTTNVGVFTQRNVTGVTPTSITIDGTPVSVLDGTYINQYLSIMFGKGFDVASPYTIAQFIARITDPLLGIEGLQVAINGLSNTPAAFLQILEPTIIDSNREFSMDYWYWQQVNFTFPPPLPGSANLLYQNSDNFENASMAAFDDVIYIANGWDYPQKYDGQTVYRVGMPQARFPVLSDNTVFLSLPFVTGNVYEYAITYEQIDNRSHSVEGEISTVTTYTVVAANSAANVLITNLQSSLQNNWNTNGAVATGVGTTVYGPDIDGMYYDLVGITPGYTLKIGDSAYYQDSAAAVMNAGGVFTGVVLSVNAGHVVLPGDTIYFFDSSGNEIQRVVQYTTPTSITIESPPVTINPTLGVIYSRIIDYKVGKVFGNVAIVNLDQTNVNVINVDVGYTIQTGDVVDFYDSSMNLQRRNITATGAGTITIDGIPVSVSNNILIYSEDQRGNAINIQRTNFTPIVITNGSPISNNLRINIYRTLQGQTLLATGDIYFVASIPNNSFNITQTYVDGLADIQLGFAYDNPDEEPNPPPISKYLLSFGSQMFYAGGQRGQNENTDNVFFSEVNSPEIVPLATNFYTVPNVDDDITGIGVAGSTLITTKNRSLWAITGNLSTGQIEVIQVAKGTNIGCAAHASIASVGSLMYFCDTSGVYSITENQLFPTDSFGQPIPISNAIDVIFRTTNFLPSTQYVFKRSVGFHAPKDKQYWLFLPCEDSQSSIRTANLNSIIVVYDYKYKNWFMWNNINAAGGIVEIDDDIYFQERVFSAVNGNRANLYKQHRFYRLIDHADHSGAQYAQYLTSWEDLGQPEVLKKFSKAILLMDRFSMLQQVNEAQINFTTYLNRIPNLQNTIATVQQVDNTMNAGWSTSPWNWNYWSGYQDSFIKINLKQGTVAKSIQLGLQIQGINMDIALSGFQIEAIPENRLTVVP